MTGYRRMDVQRREAVTSEMRIAIDRLHKANSIMDRFVMTDIDPDRMDEVIGLITDANRHLESVHENIDAITGEMGSPEL